MIGWPDHSMISLAVLRGRRICLKYGYIFHAHAPVSHLAKSTARFVVEIFCQVLRRRVQLRERLKIIDHLMIEPVNHMFQHLAQILEIEQQSGSVEFLACERHPHLVVVAMRVLTLALVVPQVMSRSKRIFDRDFEHEPLSGSWKTSQSGTSYCIATGARIAPTSTM